MIINCNCTKDKKVVANEMAKGAKDSNHAWVRCTVCGKEHQVKR